MFGYASDETPECMPLTLQLAHQMNKKIADLRRDGTLWWARPDSKTQVTAEYMFEGGACVPIRVHTVVVSCQHSEKVTLEALRKDIMEKVVGYRNIFSKYIEIFSEIFRNIFRNISRRRDSLGQWGWQRLFPRGGSCRLQRRRVCQRR